jgi:hypothetical protein
VVQPVSCSQVVSLMPTITRTTFPWLRIRREVQEVRLGGLSPRAAQGLVSAMLGDAIDSALTARIAERAGGNAFYLEEMIRAAAEGGLRELPDTVFATVQARLVEPLPGRARAGLPSCAAARRRLRLARGARPRRRAQARRRLAGGDGRGRRRAARRAQRARLSARARGPAPPHRGGASAARSAFVRRSEIRNRTPRRQPGWAR